MGVESMHVTFATAGALFRTLTELILATLWGQLICELFIRALFLLLSMLALIASLLRRGAEVSQKAPASQVVTT